MNTNSQKVIHESRANRSRRRNAANWHARRPAQAAMVLVFVLAGLGAVLGQDLSYTIQVRTGSGEDVTDSRIERGELADVLMTVRNDGSSAVDFTNAVLVFPVPSGMTYLTPSSSSFPLQGTFNEPWRLYDRNFDEVNRFRAEDAYRLVFSIGSITSRLPLFEPGDTWTVRMLFANGITQMASILGDKYILVDDGQIELSRASGGSNARSSSGSTIDEGSIQACAAIENDIARLDCYDRAVQGLPQRTPTNATPREDSGSARSRADFEIVSSGSRRTSTGSLEVYGEVRNNSNTAQGVQLEIVVRDASGVLVDSDSFWPASTSNIPPGRSRGFDWAFDVGPEAASFDVQVVEQRAW